MSPQWTGSFALQARRSLLAGLVASAGMLEPAHAQTLELADALSEALRVQPQYLAQQQVLEQSRGAVQAQRGRFDPVAYTSVGATRTRDPLNASLRAALAAAGSPGDFNGISQRQAALGLRAESESALQWTVESRYASAYDGTSSFMQGLPRQNTTTLVLSVRKPLARGSTARAVGIDLAAAELDAQAQRAQTFHAAVTLAAQVGAAYWQLSAQQELLSVAVEIEKRAQLTLAEVTRLTEADRIPRAEVESAQANLSLRTGQRIGAQQGLSEARFALGALLAGDALALSRYATVTVRPLPRLATPDVHRWAASMDDATVPARRWDLRGAELRVDAQRLRVDLARDQRLHQLDLVVSAGTRALGEGTQVTSPVATGAGSTVFVGLESSLPVRRDTASGVLRQQSAVLEQLQLQRAALETQAMVRARQALRSVVLAVEQGESATRAAEAYERVVGNEEKKRRLGQSTMLDVVTAESRYIDSLIAAVQARQAAMLALVSAAAEWGLLAALQADDTLSLDTRVLEGRL